MSPARLWTCIIVLSRFLQRLRINLGRVTVIYTVGKGRGVPKKRFRSRSGDVSGCGCKGIEPGGKRTIETNAAGLGCTAYYKKENTYPVLRVVLEYLCLQNTVSNSAR